MAKLDKFIDMMVQRQVERAVIIGGQRLQIFIKGQKTEGSIIAADQLRQALQEVTPEHLRPQIEAGGSFHFRYDSPQGPYEVGADTFFDVVQVTLSPGKSQPLAASNSASAPQPTSVVAPQSAPIPQTPPSQTSPTQPHSGAVHTLQGVQDVLQVFEDKLTITPKGILGFMNKGIKGTKEIPFHSITAVQFKEAGSFINGYIQFTIPGGNENSGGVFAATKDENSFLFAAKDNEAARLIKNYIDWEVRKLRTSQVSQSPANLSDELQKLAALKAQGILSDDEFQAAKKKLIGS